MSEITKGPWRSDPENGCWVVEENKDDGERAIAHVYTTSADAALVASAPDLLEALREARTLIDDRFRDHRVTDRKVHLDSSASAVAQIIDAALAKAGVP